MCFLGVIAIILRFTSRNMGAAAVVRAVAIDLKDIFIDLKYKITSQNVVVR